MARQARPSPCALPVLLLVALPLTFLHGTGPQLPQRRLAERQVGQARAFQADRRRVALRYWQSKGPKPEKETVEGTVIPGLILTVLILYMSVIPLTVGVTPEFLLSLLVIAILGIIGNVLALAANMNLPTWIDFQIQKRNQEAKKDKIWPWQ
ncbi:unnamed protein product [Cladocopium goreaui]|uniref:Polypeptide N-acetylgalactosaminyltransferase 3 n=1 Tax=Cladocopium goreaui TaxID=2562237 RepID=A0A9P1FM74_9DINO|nr:unnamed protein product [Cladocopium goreaui]